MESEMLPIIGQTVDVQFPEWGGVWVRAKVDTGAGSCALHAEDVREEEENGIATLSFELKCGVQSMNGEVKSVRCKTTHFGFRKVRNSFGVSQRRYKVTAIVAIQGKEYTVPCTLTNRSRMKYAMLFGAKAIKGNFLIDLSRNF